MTIDFIGVIAPLCILPPIFIAVIRWRFLIKEAKWICWYLLITALISFAATIIGKVFHKNNMPLVHLLTAIEMLLFIGYYKTLLSKKEKNPLYLILSVGFIVFCIINAFYIQGIYSYSSYTRSVEAIICILFALNYFARLATGKTISSWSSNPDFYFNAGIFLYFSGAFMLFIFSNFIVSNLSKPDFMIIWTIHAVLVLLMYLFFTFAFILCKK
ncbi:MAG: hypothetical protein ACKOU7_13175 [Ferruginibacter sp.]